MYKDGRPVWTLDASVMNRRVHVLGFYLRVSQEVPYKEYKNQTHVATARWMGPPGPAGSMG
jgi:hypothetical protein